MNNNTTNKTRKPYNANLKELWERGKNLYWQGAHAYSVTNKGIRQVGYYLYMGDKEMGIDPMGKDNLGRAQAIFKVFTKWLHWSKEKLLELWKDIWGACCWRKGLIVDSILTIPELPIKDSSSSNSSNSNKVSTISTIENRENPKLSRDEIMGIMKGVLGEKLDLEKPSNMTTLMLKAVGFRT